MGQSSVPALRLSLHSKHLPPHYSTGLGTAMDLVPHAAVPDPCLALLGRRGLHATCQDGQLTGHDLGPCPDPACFSDSLWTPAIPSIQQHGQELSKSKSFLWLLLTLRKVHHTRVEKEPMSVDVRLQAHEKFLQTGSATSTVFSSIIAPSMSALCWLWSFVVWGRAASTWLATLMQHFYRFTGPTQEIWSTILRNHPKTLEASSRLPCLPILGTHISYIMSPY